jgi:hypothetical protein
MLEKFKIRNGYYPEILYLQVDGGSENANQYVFAMLELLVVKRCCRDVYFSRLPADIRTKISMQLLQSFGHVFVPTLAKL